MTSDSAGFDPFAINSQYLDWFTPAHYDKVPAVLAWSFMQHRVGMPVIEAQQRTRDLTMERRHEIAREVESRLQTRFSKPERYRAADPDLWASLPEEDQTVAGATVAQCFDVMAIWKAVVLYQVAHDYFSLPAASLEGLPGEEIEEWKRDLEPERNLDALRALYDVTRASGLAALNLKEADVATQLVKRNASDGGKARAQKYAAARAKVAELMRTLRKHSIDKTAQAIYEALQELDDPTLQKVERSTVYGYVRELARG